LHPTTRSSSFRPLGKRFEKTDGPGTHLDSCATSPFLQPNVNGPIAQLAALACHANGAVLGDVSGRFLSDNSTCRYCDSVSFLGPQHGAPGPVQEARSADEWLAWFRSAGVLGARLRWTAQNDPAASDRMTAGFVGGGGHWRLEVLQRDGTSEFWMAGWKLWNQQAPDRRIWRVQYHLDEVAPTSWRVEVALEAAIHELTEALIDIAEFSRRESCDPFTELFETALSSLSSTARAGYHQDLAPPGVLTESEARVLDACQPAYVFGGMGSWNDRVFDGTKGEEYERVSERAFLAIHHAIPAAVNGFAGRRRGGP
jgi:hypothetical protein